MLADARVDPAADDNYAIRVSAQGGHLGIVDLLLAHARVDPAAEDNYAIRLASDNGHQAVVDRLLADARVDPTALGSAALRGAVEGGRFPVVDSLLRLPSVIQALTSRVYVPADHRHAAERVFLELPAKLWLAAWRRRAHLLIRDAGTTL